MKRFTLLISFFAFLATISAQDRNWSFGANLGLQFSDAFAFQNGIFDGEIFEEFNEESKFSPAPFLGLQVFKQLNGSLFIRLGLTGESRISLMNGFEVSEIEGWPRTGFAKFYNQENYLSLESEFYVKLLKKEKWNWAIGLGPFLSNTLSQNGIIKIDGERVELGRGDFVEIHPFKFEHVEFGFSLITGLSFKMYDQMNLGIFAFAKHPIKEFGDGIEATLIYRSLGLRVGFDCVF